MPDYSNWQRDTAKDRDSLSSNLRSGTVAVAEMVMHRIVAPDHAGSIPVGHPLAGYGVKDNTLALKAENISKILINQPFSRSGAMVAQVICNH